MGYTLRYHLHEKTLKTQWIKTVIFFCCILGKVYKYVTVETLLLL